MSYLSEDFLPEQMPFIPDDPTQELNNLFNTLRLEIPLDGIAIAFLDNATFSTYWLKHFGVDEIDNFPSATIHSQAEIKDLVDNSTWNSEQNWMRIINQPNRVVMAKFFTKLINLNDISLIQVRSNYDSSKKANIFFYVKNLYMYTTSHLQALAKHQQYIFLLSTLIIKSFLLERLSIVRQEELKEYVESTTLPEMATQSALMQEIVEKLKAVANFPTPILFQGETGVGKEVLADFIHAYSLRHNMPFIKINCGAISPNLLDSELFGHEKGSFTGAIAQKAGCFERAHKGFIFLDELGEMPHETQLRLLRVLQTNTFERVGGNKAIYSDFRVIAATNKNLAQLVSEGKFREDLFYRVSVFPIYIPPLRERLEDLPLLVRILLRSSLKKLHLTVDLVISSENIAELSKHPWKGNVRELQGAVEASIINYIVAKNSKKEVQFWVKPQVSVFPDSKAVENKNIKELAIEPINASSIASKKEEVVIQKEESKILSFDEEIYKILTHALSQCHGKVYGDKGAANFLKLKPTTLWGKLNKYNIRPEDFQ